MMAKIPTRYRLVGCEDGVEHVLEEGTTDFTFPPKRLNDLSLWTKTYLAILHILVVALLGLLFFHDEFDRLNLVGWASGPVDGQTWCKRFHIVTELTVYSSAVTMEGTNQQSSAVT